MAVIRCGGKALKVYSHGQYQGEDFNPDFTSPYLASVSVWQVFFFVDFFFYDNGHHVPGTGQVLNIHYFLPLP